MILWLLLTLHHQEKYMTNKILNINYKLDYYY